MSLAPANDRIGRDGPAGDVINFPGNLEAEQAILGALMGDGQYAFPAVSAFLSARHFAEPFHQRLYEALAERLTDGRVADPVLMADRFREDPGFIELGGMSYFGLLISHAPPAHNAADYAREVFETSLRRDLALVCSQGLRELANRAAQPFSVATEIRSRIEALESAGAPDDASLVDAPTVARRAVAGMMTMAAEGKPRGLMSGLRCTDRRLNGLKPGNLIVIGGRPGMCKTGLARAIAHGASVRNPNHLFLFMNMEMEGTEVMQRELSALSHEYGDGLPYRTMESGSLTPLDFMQIESAEARVPPNLILDERCEDLSVDDVRRKIWALSRRGKIGAVFIDYLQLMRRPNAEGRNEASVISEMTRSLKKIATRFKVCIVLLSQLNRSVESRDDKKPQLADLRESGSIEQDADAVLFPFREAYYLIKAEPKASDPKHRTWEDECELVRRKLEVICAKQRGGPEGIDHQRYFAEFDFIEDDD